MSQKHQVQFLFCFFCWDNVPHTGNNLHTTCVFLRFLCYHSRISISIQNIWAKDNKKSYIIQFCWRIKDWMTKMIIDDNHPSISLSNPCAFPKKWWWSEDDDDPSIFLPNHLPFLAESIKRSFWEDYRGTGAVAENSSSLKILKEIIMFIIQYKWTKFLVETFTWKRWSIHFLASLAKSIKRSFWEDYRRRHSAQAFAENSPKP